MLSLTGQLLIPQRSKLSIWFILSSASFLRINGLTGSGHLRRHTCCNPIYRNCSGDPSLWMFKGVLSSSLVAGLSTMTSSNLKTKMSEWSFSDPLLASLPIDPETENFIRRHVPKAILSQVRPTPFKTKPKLVAVSSEVLRDILDMDPDLMSKDPDFVEWVSGNKVLDGSIPMAHRYGGHQFGSWAEQLGDGRAHLLGEYVNSRGQRWELQLKGSGRTPYSRFGDGRAVLRSSVREFLCSEAMFHLGVPTSRAAALVVTDDMIPRDIFYNGNAKLEPCAVVLRLSPTWFRIGSLEILARHGEVDELQALVDFILTNNFPDIRSEVPNQDDQVLAFFDRVVRESTEMVAQWMAVGFAHGVLNTDNLSLGSVTIDYGPFGFLDAYDPYFIPNHSDDSGRYDYESQPAIVFWNLQRMAQALTAVLPTNKQLQIKQILDGYHTNYEKVYTKLFCKKLGLTFNENSVKEDKRLIQSLLEVMYSMGADFTQTFRDLSEISLQDLKDNRDKMCPVVHWGLAKVRSSKDFEAFLNNYSERLSKEFGSAEDSDNQRMERMQSSNPRYILRNWIAQQAIEAAEKGDFSEVQLVLKVLKSPYTVQPEAEAAGYAKPVPAWSKKLVVSCSS